MALEDSMRIVEATKEDHGITSNAYLYLLRKSTKAHYNYTKITSTNRKFEPLQNPIIRNEWMDIDNPIHREYIWYYSPYMRTHADDIAQSILTRGWTYEPEINVDWNESLKNAFVECYALATTVDTAAIFEFKDIQENLTYLAFSSNYFDDVYFDSRNQSRNITSIMLDFPEWDTMIDENPESSARLLNTKLRFKTQYHYDVLHNINLTPVDMNENPDEKLPGKCVVFTPKPSGLSCYGRPYLIRECFTALRKMALDWYENIYMHKGGNSFRISAVPGNTNANVITTLKNELKYGINSEGVVVTLPSTAQSIKDVFEFTETASSPIDFNTINSHISEDSFLPKQTVEGAAETGALGGSAPAQNADDEDETVTEQQALLIKLIQDINFQYFGKDAKSYKIRFNRPNPQATSFDVSDKTIDKESKVPSNATSSTQTEIKEEEEEMEHGFPVLLQHSATPTIMIDGHQMYHYRGSMLQAGTYDYPEKNKRITYTPQEIQNYTQLPEYKRQGIIGEEHKLSQADLALGDDLGWFKTIGFDEQTKADITDFYTYHDYGDEFYVSPSFYKRDTPKGKLLWVQTCHKVQNPRSALTGLTTAAKKC